MNFKSSGFKNLYQNVDNRYIIVIFFSSMIYFYYLTRYFWYDFDTVYYIEQVEKNPTWLWNWIGINLENIIFTYVSCLLSFFGFSPKESIFFITSLFASLTLILVYVQINYYFKSRTLSIIGVFILFSNWAYILAVKSGSNKTIVMFFTLLYIFYVTKYIQLEKFQFKHMIFLGLLLGLAVSSHATNIFLLMTIPFLINAMIKNAKKNNPITNSTTIQGQNIENQVIPSKIQENKKKKKIYIVLLKISIFATISLIVFIGLIILSYIIIYEDEFLEQLTKINIYSFFPRGHSGFLSWNQNVWAITLRERNGPIYEQWQGFTETIYGIDLYKFEHSQIILVVHCIVLMFVILYGSSLFYKKDKLIFVLFVGYLLWTLLYESYEPERWSWVILFFPILEIATIEKCKIWILELKKKVKESQSIKKQSVRTQTLSISIIGFLILIPFISQNIYVSWQYSPEIYAYQEIEDACNEYPEYGNLIIAPVEPGHTYRFYIGFNAYTNYKSYEYRYYFPNEFENLRRYWRNTTSGFLIFWNKDELNEFYLSQYKYFKINNNSIFKNELGFVYLFNFTIQRKYNNINVSDQVFYDVCYFNGINTFLNCTFMDPCFFTNISTLTNCTLNDLIVFEKKCIIENCIFNKKCTFKDEVIIRGSCEFHEPPEFQDSVKFE